MRTDMGLGEVALGANTGRPRQTLPRECRAVRERRKAETKRYGRCIFPLRAFPTHTLRRQVLQRGEQGQLVCQLPDPIPRESSVSTTVVRVLARTSQTVPGGVRIVPFVSNVPERFSAPCSPSQRVRARPDLQTTRLPVGQVSPFRWYCLWEQAVHQATWDFFWSRCNMRALFLERRSVLLDVSGWEEGSPFSSLVLLAKGRRPRHHLSSHLLLPSAFWRADTHPMGFCLRSFASLEAGYDVWLPASEPAQRGAERVPTSSSRQARQRVAPVSLEERAGPREEHTRRNDEDMKEETSIRSFRLQKQAAWHMLAVGKSHHPGTPFHRACSTSRKNPTLSSG
ncbi:MAG TPA: hypothetical protein VFV38_17170 [Ktedonobacteraceae bacterium]|nr:hypothetical protein [Ktedonobacteraceae bacterium]